ncbi:MAG TPA: class I SAM-dependent methyltransferase [Clostridiales bacterium]|nr:class I SAM-dependent methyltransferase [Clostridiales bacterium]
MKKSTERFSDRVENYVKYRPGYPKEFIDYLYANAGFSEESVIADIGSGTGILTALLLERGSRAIGIEPNREMRNAEPLMAELEMLFDKYAADGKVSFEYETEAFIGEI